MRTIINNDIERSFFFSKFQELAIRRLVKDFYFCPWRCQPTLVTYVATDDCRKRKVGLPSVKGFASDTFVISADANFKKLDRLVLKSPEKGIVGATILMLKRLVFVGKAKAQQKPQGNWKYAYQEGKNIKYPIPQKLPPQDCCFFLFAF